MPRGLPVLILAGWFILTPVTIAASITVLGKSSGQFGGVVLGSRDSRYDAFVSRPPLLGATRQEITSGDARPHLIEKFLRQYKSPISGHGAYFVEMADKYGVDWKLVAAIAFQESNLGKRIPSGSFNAWGWAVYTGQNSGAAFDSWPHAIETVTRGIARDYYGRGLKTPEQIMTRYTPNSNGSWAEAINFAMEEIED